MDRDQPRTIPRKSALFDDYTLSEIRRAAATGIYDIRGGGAKRRVPHFDDLLLLGASVSRYPLEGLSRALRDRCRGWGRGMRRSPCICRSRSPSPA